MQAPVFLPLIFCLLWIVLLAKWRTTPLQARHHGWEAVGDSDADGIWRECLAMRHGRMSV
jgi:hypothetical protein